MKITALDPSLPTPLTAITPPPPGAPRDRLSTGSPSANWSPPAEGPLHGPFSGNTTPIPPWSSEFSLFPHAFFLAPRLTLATLPAPGTLQTLPRWREGAWNGICCNAHTRGWRVSPARGADVSTSTATAVTEPPLVCTWLMLVTLDGSAKKRMHSKRSSSLSNIKSCQFPLKTRAPWSGLRCSPKRAIHLDP